MGLGNDLGIVDTLENSAVEVLCLACEANQCDPD
jgi:hypothetical protein